MKNMYVRFRGLVLSILILFLLGFYFGGGAFSDIGIIKQAAAQDNYKDPLTEFRKQNNSEVPYVAPDLNNVKNLRPIDKNTFFSSQKDGADTVDDDASDANNINKQAQTVNEKTLPFCPKPKVINVIYPTTSVGFDAKSRNFPEILEIPYLCDMAKEYLDKYKDEFDINICSPMTQENNETINIFLTAEVQVTDWYTPKEELKDEQLITVVTGLAIYSNAKCPQNLYNGRALRALVFTNAMSEETVRSRAKVVFRDTIDQMYNYAPWGKGGLIFFDGFETDEEKRLHKEEMQQYREWLEKRNK